jgi:hypothetical protein
MDQRCDDAFLGSLPAWLDKNGNEESKISTGYGIATMAWMHRNKRLKPEWNTCGIIMDFFNFLLTRQWGYISNQIAYSFGYCTMDNEWQKVFC